MPAGSWGPFDDEDLPLAADPRPRDPCDDSPVPPAAPHDDLAFHRGLMLLAAVVVPLFGLVQWGIGYDPFGPRLAFAAAALAILAGTYRSPAIRRHARVAALLFCCALLLWFTYIAYRHGMSMEDVIGLVPIVAGVAVLFRRAWEVAAFLAFMAVDLALAFAAVDRPGVDFSVFASVLGTFAIILGAMSVWRSRLVDALRLANETLEERVAERTVRLEREVAERVAAEARANAANEAKSRFLANMSHELRTPLNAVIGYTELVADELSASEQAHLGEDLRRVDRAAHHLLTLIDDILDLSRIEAGTLVLRRDRVPVRGALDDALVIVGPAIERSRCRLRVDVADHLAVRGDRSALTRVLVHLLDNAAKFTDDGEIAVTAADTGDDTHALHVRDTGVGIPEPALAAIFDRFTQADESSTRIHGGAGLGLALSRELIARMGGTITAQSAVGRGSTFTITLPRA